MLTDFSLTVMRKTNVFFKKKMMSVSFILFFLGGFFLVKFHCIYSLKDDPWLTFRFTSRRLFTVRGLPPSFIYSYLLPYGHTHRRDHHFATSSLRFIHFIDIQTCAIIRVKLLMIFQSRFHIPSYIKHSVSFLTNLNTLMMNLPSSGSVTPWGCRNWNLCDFLSSSYILAFFFSPLRHMDVRPALPTNDQDFHFYLSRTHQIIKRKWRSKNIAEPFPVRY